MAEITEEYVVSSELNEKLCFGRAWPLPRLSDILEGAADTYEVVVVGAGPAGLLLTLELARLGLTDASLLCVDAKDDGSKAGHADGVNARSQEILRTLGLEAEVLRDGNTFSEMTLWRPSEHDASRLERVIKQPFLYNTDVRYDQLRTIHQGRIEKIFKSDLQKYSKHGVSYSSAVQRVRLDEKGSPEYPVVVVLDHAGTTRTVRTKYLVGCDGAHSSVRKSMEILMEGDVTDRVWGVIDFVPDTNFPDIRRVCSGEGVLGAGRGDWLIVPRERLSNGECSTRLYIDMTEYDEVGALTDGVADTVVNTSVEASEAIKEKRAAITANAILERGTKEMRQYRFRMKAGTQPFWWAAYSVGQRLAKQYTISDSKGVPRILLAGDAAHTHSPRQGQGMNISMQDSHNLAWKLAYAIFGLTPSPSQLLQTYESERRPAASRVVFFDKRWNQSDMPMEEKILESKEQVLGCGLEYDCSVLVGAKAEDVESTGKPYPVTGKEYIHGILRAGRRLPNVRLRRFADGTAWDIHDDLLANGLYRVVVISSDDFPQPSGKSLPAATAVCGAIVKKFPRGLVEAIILQPDMSPTWEFEDLPSCIKDEAEMRLHCAGQEVYEFWGLNVKKGALLLVRPDGMVATITELEDVASLDLLLQQVLIMA